MTLKECHIILQVRDGATLDDVKRAYRRLAFELHPDLNPHRKDASRRFQQLNEAYVLLTRHLESSDPFADAARNTFEEARRAQSQQQGNGAAGRAGANDDPLSKQNGFAGGRFGGGGAAHGAGGGQRSGGASESGTSAADGASRSAGSAGNASAKGAGRARRMAETAYAGKEDVLRDILRDPFARRVFEDIYSQIRRDGGRPDLAKPPRKRKLSLEWGSRKLSLDLTHGVGGAVRGWLRKQIDEEQTMYLPAVNLVPGARLRLQVSQGLSGETRTVEVTLPQDFVVGRPLRLKGLGKSIGPWQGDLYLRLLAKV